MDERILDIYYLKLHFNCYDIFLFLKCNYTFTEFGNYLLLHSLGGDSNFFIEEYDTSVTSP